MCLVCACSISCIMPAYLLFTIFKNYLELQIDGQGEPTSVVKESKMIWLNLKRISERESQNRILIKVKVDQPLPLDNCSDIVQMALDSGLQKQSRIALLDQQGNNLLFVNLCNSFLQYVGFQTEVFKNTRMAKKWLLQH